MVDGVSDEEDCQYSDCQRVAYIQFDLGFDSRWFCFGHAIEMFDSWDDHDSLEITEFPDESFFDCVGYPAKLSMLVAAYEHGDHA